jgi:neutral ceramidase
MKVGFASRTLTVPPGSSMGGYAFREGVAEGILDELSVSVVTWYDGTRRAALALLDVICVNADLTRAARAAVSGVDILWLAASHTHAGPETGCVPGGTATPPVWLDRLTRAVAATVAAAVDTEAEATGRVHSGALAGVGAVRSRITQEAIVPLDVIEVVAANGGAANGAAANGGAADGGAAHGGAAHGAAADRIGVIVVLPVHPTVLPAENLMVSADLTGAVRRALADRLAPGTWAVVATGAAGDISTRRTRLGQDAAELARLGAVVADRCVEVLAEPAGPGWSATSSLAGRSRKITLRGKPPVDGAALLAQATMALHNAADPVASRIARGNLEGARLAASIPSNASPGDGIEAEVATLRIGELTLAALPGEPFLSSAHQLRPMRTVVLGYANAYPGYLPPLDAYRSASYEVLAAAAAPGSAEEILQVARELLTKGES